MLAYYYSVLLGLVIQPQKYFQCEIINCLILMNIISKKQGEQQVEGF